MKRNATRRTLIMSALSLLLCCAMLIGSTAAWFTDTATSTGNKIQAGTLDIDLVMDKAGNGTYTSIADADAPLFGADSGLAQNDPTDTLWEPGKTQIAYLGVQNKGNLALKYNIILDVADNGLASALEYAIIPGAKAADLTAATKWDDIKTAAGTDNIGTVAAGRITAAQNGVLDEIVNGTKNETQYFALAVHMKEEAGNEYQDQDITIDVNVQANQLPVEKDSFGDQYDDISYSIDTSSLDYYSCPDNPGQIKAGGTVSLTFALPEKYWSDEEKYYLAFDNTAADMDIEWDRENHKFTLKIANPKEDIVIDDGYETCLAAGTLITMADGTKKKVEDIVEGDMVKTFDHETGTVSASRVILNFTYPDPMLPFTLYFEDEFSLSLTCAHSLLEQSTRKYVKISFDNVEEYIGKSFYGEDGKWHKLLNYSVGSEVCDWYSLYTANHLNSFANGMLQVPSDVDCYLNIYELNENLKADPDQLAADIEKYGLFSYDEIKDDYDVDEGWFNDTNGKYNYVIIGKGLATYDYFVQLFEDM